jgi:N-methylhydantoinase A/oxoprolinase/acetone carboxylase beta subunit
MKIFVQVGVDTGGTFTDFVFFKSGKISIKKISSTPRDPSVAILKGIHEYLAQEIPILITHGTTVATNSLLQRKGGKIALITTKGFEDIIFIGRQVRSKLYSLKGEKRRPLLPPNRCFGLAERTLSDGKIDKKIHFPDLIEIIGKIKKSGVEAVAVSLINSYANFANEKIIQRELLKNKILTSLSSIILPEHREYERTTVTAVNAYLMPVIGSYLDSLDRKIKKAKLQVMQSNEGYISPTLAKEEPIKTALSGPAAGVVAAFRLSKAAGYKDIITFDMGGTSSDVSLVDGKIQRTNESFIGDFPIRLPMIDIHTVGAGGGSIAYIDGGGSLRVGPQSSGADPGPACYGKGNLPTVTDANVVMGRLVPEFFLGGKMKILPDRSWKSIKILAKRIGKSTLNTAAGIIEIANANMEKAIRVISIERGIDPKNFALFSFGGAGGMHSVEIASNLKIPKVIIPNNAGVLSAFGLLLADSVKDYSKSYVKPVKTLDMQNMVKQLSLLGDEGLKDMKKEGFNEKEIKISFFLDLRYIGQSYEITLPVSLNNLPEMSFLADFSKEHQKQYSFHHPDREVEIVNIRAKAIGVSKKIKLQKYTLSGSSPPSEAYFHKQKLYYKGRPYQASVYKKSLLEPGNKITGPALVVDSESTTFLPPAFNLSVDVFLNLVIQRENHE